MKKVIILFIGLLFLNCEDPIDLKLNDSNQILVVDAFINWIKEDQTSEQEVILSLTSPYFQENYKSASGANVFIEDEEGKIYSFTEEGQSGRYLTLDTIPYSIDKVFTLNIEYNGQYYSGKESLISVSDINRVEQEKVNFFGRESIQLQANSLDPVEERNFSFFEFRSDKLKKTEYNIYRDDFSSGTEYYGFLLSDELESGDKVQIRQYGLSNIAYNFWYLLIFQNTEQGGPFQTTPVNIIGNMVHQSNSKLNPLGYFRISEVSEILYTVKWFHKKNRLKDGFKKNKLVYEMLLWFLLS